MSTAAEIVRTMDRIERGQEAIVKTQNEIYERVHSLDMKITGLPCEIHKKDIGLLQKVVYGCVGLILIGFIGTILYPNDPKRQSRKIMVNDSERIEYYDNLPENPNVIWGNIVVVGSEDE